MEIMLFDPARGVERRAWKQLLPPDARLVHVDVDVDNEILVDFTSRRPVAHEHDAVIGILWRSPLVTASAIEDIAKKYTRCRFVVVAGKQRETQSALENLYYRRVPVGSPDEGFRCCFKKYWAALLQTGLSDF